MKRTFTRRFKVRHYEIDSFGHLNNAVYVNYMQEAAIEASADVGFDLDWYEENGTRWLMRKLAVRYFAPVTYGDEIDVTTWVSDFRRVRSHREYDVRRVSDGERLVRARADWVYVDAESGKPIRVPEHAVKAFAPSGELPDIGLRLREPKIMEDCYRYHSYRKVQSYELDSAQYVNHANHLRWVEQAYFDAANSVGFPVSRMLEDSWLVLQAGHEIEYFQPARAGDSIEIVSWVCEMARLRGAWTHEIYNADSGQLLARDYSLGAFVDGDFRPEPLPAQILESFLAGPDRPVNEDRESHSK